MNEYIKPIFEKVIPLLESKNIKYWIYGGMGYAAMVGVCYRNNMDIDLFVLENDFQRIKNILAKLCEENNWELREIFVNNGPKIEVLIMKKNKWIERLSIIPAYIKDGFVKLNFKGGSKEYVSDILERIRRRLEDITIFTINDSFLKRLFVEYLDSKKKYLSKRIEDARHILSKEEFKKYFPNEQY